MGVGQQVRNPELGTAGAEHRGESAPVCLGTWAAVLYIVLVPFRQ